MDSVDFLRLCGVFFLIEISWGGLTPTGIVFVCLPVVLKSLNSNLLINGHNMK
jgi:hypothetical protein